MKPVCLLQLCSCVEGLCNVSESSSVGQLQPTEQSVLLEPETSRHTIIRLNRCVPAVRHPREFLLTAGLLVLL